MKKLVATAFIAVVGVYFLVACQRGESTRMGETSFHEGGLLMSDKTSGLSVDQFRDILLRQQERNALPQFCGFGDETTSAAQCKIFVIASELDHLRISVDRAGEENATYELELDIPSPVALEDVVFQSGVKYKLARLGVGNAMVEFLLRNDHLAGLVIHNPRMDASEATRLVLDTANSQIDPDELF